MHSYALTGAHALRDGESAARRSRRRDERTGDAGWKCSCPDADKLAGDLLSNAERRRRVRWARRYTKFISADGPGRALRSCRACVVIREGGDRRALLDENRDAREGEVLRRHIRERRRREARDACRTGATPGAPEAIMIRGNRSRHGRLGAPPVVGEHGVVLNEDRRA